MGDFSTKYLNQTCLSFILKEFKATLWTVAVLLESMGWNKKLHLKNKKKTYMLECSDERNLFVCVCVCVCFNVNVSSRSSC